MWYGAMTWKLFFEALLNPAPRHTIFLELPAVKDAGWHEMVQVREEVYFNKGRIIVGGKPVMRGKAKKADSTTSRTSPSL